MEPRDLLPLVWSNLRRMKGRVTLTAIGVAIGTASLVVLVALGAGLQRLSRDFTSDSALTEIHFTPHADFRVVEGAELDGMASEAPPSRCGIALDAMPVVDDAMRETFSALPGVSWVAVYESLLGTPDIVYGRLHGSANVRGFEPSLFGQRGLQPALGTIAIARGEAVLGAGFAASLYDPVARARGGAALNPARAITPPTTASLLGETLTLRLETLASDGTRLEKTVRVRVVGILASAGWLYDDGIYLLQRDVIDLNTWMHGRRAGQRRDPARQGYTGVVLKVGDLDDVAGVEEAVQALGFPLYTERRQLEEWTSFFTTVQLFLGGIGAISLLVAAFGISNTMLMAVHERTREIGLMKALGASNRAVVAIFLSESAGLGVAGGAGGVVLGLGLILGLNARGSTSLAGLPAAGATVPIWLPFFALLFAAFVGIGSGTYPARRAARLVPIAALKAE